MEALSKRWHEVKNLYKSILSLEVPIRSNGIGLVTLILTGHADEQKFR